MKRTRISYSPMSDMEASRDDYLSNIYHKDDELFAHAENEESTILFAM